MLKPEPQDNSTDPKNMPLLNDEQVSLPKIPRGDTEEDKMMFQQNEANSETAMTLYETSMPFPTMLLYDGLWHFKGYHGCASFCHLRIYQSSAQSSLYIVMTELDANTGTSVTNAVESIANEIWKDLHHGDRACHGLQFPSPVWIEHYPNRGIFNAKTSKWEIPETFDLVEFEQSEEGAFCRPQWRSYGRAKLETSILEEFLPLP
jgi:hypothetical protein